MAVYAEILNHRPFYKRGGANGYQTVSTKMENSSVYRFNLILVAMAIVAMTTYIFLSNLLVSQRYALGLRWSELNRLNAGLLTEEQQGVSYNMKELLIYGQKSGLIEAKDIDSILENDGFAVLNR